MSRSSHSRAGVLSPGTCFLCPRGGRSRSAFSTWLKSPMTTIRQPRAFASKSCSSSSALTSVRMARSASAASLVSPGEGGGPVLPYILTARMAAFVGPTRVTAVTLPEQPRNGARYGMAECQMIAVPHPLEWSAHRVGGGKFHSPIYCTCVPSGLMETCSPRPSLSKNIPAARTRPVSCRPSTDISWRRI